MNKIIVFQTDFGLDDAAISAMEGVSYSVSQDLNIRHLTHNIPFIFRRQFQCGKYIPFREVNDPSLIGQARGTLCPKAGICRDVHFIPAVLRESRAPSGSRHRQQQA